MRCTCCSAGGRGTDAVHISLKDLVRLQAKYGPQGFDVVAFPSYEFANEEFPTCKKIKDFVAGYKGEHLKLMEPVKVNGPEASPVWKFLKDPATCASCAGEVEWNFAAWFLVDRSGSVVERFASNPTAKEPLIRELLAAAAA